jgi:hypothetical protein
MEILSWKFSYESIGYIFSLLSAIILAVAYFVTKELNIRQTHFSLINLFTAFFGLPISIGFVILSNQAGYEVKDYSQIYKTAFIYDVIYVLISASTSKIFLKFPNCSYNIYIDLKIKATFRKYFQ